MIDTFFKVKIYQAQFIFQEFIRKLAVVWVHMGDSNVIPV